MIARLPGILPGTLLAAAMRRRPDGWIRLPLAAAEVAIAFVAGWLIGPGVLHRPTVGGTGEELVAIAVIGIIVIFSAISAARYLVRGRHFIANDGAYMVDGLALLIGIVLGIGLPS